MPRRRPKAAAALLIAALFAVAAPATATDKKAVTIVGNDDDSYAFKPRKLEVREGTTVRWSWDSNAPHNVTFKQLGQASSTDDSDSFKLTFDSAGTFKYVCTVHGFRGKVLVD